MIYFITDGRNIKIGKSNNVRKRLLDLQVANANTLKVLYIFDIPDEFEKILHRRFKRFKTDSKNEWFLLDENREIILSRIGHEEFKDLKKAKLRARLINNSIFKEENSNERIKRTGIRLKERKIGRLILDIKKDLSKKNKRIIYKPYSIKYGFTNNEISYYVKSAGLSRAVYLHNSKL